MFITSYSSIVGLLYLLLSIFGGVVIFALIFGRFVVHFPGLFFKLLEVSFELFCTTIMFLLVKLLRLITLQYLFALFSYLLEEHYLNNRTENVRHHFRARRHERKLSFSERAARKLAVVTSLTQHRSMLYGFIFVGMLGILLLFTLPGGFGVEEVIIIGGCLLLAIDKILTLKRTKSLLQKAKQLERRARRAYHNEQFYDTLAQYSEALDIYRTPILAKNPRLDVNRAQLLEKIGVALYKEERFDKALMRFHQALDIYKKTHLANEPTAMKARIRVLKNTAVILYQLGRRSEALKRYELIAQLTGKPAIPKDFFAI